MSKARQIAIAGLAAGAATTVVLALFGRRDGDTAGPINAVSHILYGDEAADQRGVSAKYTLPGALLNTAAVVSWAAVQAFLFGNRRSWLAGPAISALAYVTDYYVVPRRVTPGFERRLTPAGMAAVYGVLGLSLALGSRAARARA
jgi:hypothetical protein